MVDRNAQAVAAQLLTLPAQDRARLAALLLASLEDVDADAAAAWDEEIARRTAQLEAGEVEGVPASEVFAEVERRLKAWGAVVRVAFHPAAAEEFLAAVEYYRAALPELGQRFSQAVRHATELAAERPEAGSSRGASDVRRLVVVGFPYDLVYWRRADVLEVIALAHHRRRPNYWRDRQRP
jgi:toxin ParE1/3/4